MHYAENDADAASNSTAQRIDYLGAKGILRLQVALGVKPELYRLPPLGYNLSTATDEELTLLVNACKAKAEAMAEHEENLALAFDAATLPRWQQPTLGGDILPSESTTYRLCPVCGKVATVERTGWLNQLSLHIIRQHPARFHQVSADSFKAITLPPWAIRPFVVVEGLAELPAATRETTIARTRSLSRNLSRLPRLSVRREKPETTESVTWQEDI